MKTKKLVAAFCIALSVVGLLAVGLGASSIGPWPITGTLPVVQLNATSGSGGFAFASTSGTTSYYVSSGGSAATSVPCNQVTLQLSGTGFLSTSGGTKATTGMTFATTGSGTIAVTGGTAGNGSWAGNFTNPITIPATDLNALTIVGTGTVGYIYTH